MDTGKTPGMEAGMRLICQGTLLSNPPALQLIVL
jgi:hypothetical protein